jgi:hypothetical protein
LRTRWSRNRSGTEPCKPFPFAVERVLQAIADIKIADKPLLVFNQDYYTSLNAAKAVRDALYPADSDTPMLTFRAQIRQRTGVFQALVSLGDEKLDLHENPEGRRVFTCQLIEPIACRMAIQVAEGKWIEAATEHRPWGLLRWVSGSTPEVEASGRLVLNWNLEEPPPTPPATDSEGYRYDASTAKEKTPEPPPKRPTWLIQLAIDEGPAVALFTRNVFNALLFPAAIMAQDAKP